MKKRHPLTPRKGSRLSRSTSSLHGGVAFSLAASEVSDSAYSLDAAAATAPRVEELERDLGATLQLSDERQAKIEQLEEEIRRLNREKAAVEEELQRTTCELKRKESEQEETAIKHEEERRRFQDDADALQAQLTEWKETALTSEKDVEERKSTIACLEDELRRREENILAKDEEYLTLFERMNALAESSKKLQDEARVEVEKLTDEKKVAERVAADARQGKLKGERDRCRCDGLSGKLDHHLPDLPSLLFSFLSTVLLGSCKPFKSSFHLQ